MAAWMLETQGLRAVYIKLHPARTAVGGMAQARRRERRAEREYGTLLESA